MSTSLGYNLKVERVIRSLVITRPGPQGPQGAGGGGGGGGVGTVTSVAVTGGSTGITVSGSPITSSGTITLGVTASTLRSTLQLGDSATKNVGTGSTNVAAGDHTHTSLTMTTFNMVCETDASTHQVKLVKDQGVYVLEVVQ